MQLPNELSFCTNRYFIATFDAGNLEITHVVDQFRVQILCNRKVFPSKSVIAGAIPIITEALFN